MAKRFGKLTVVVGLPGSGKSHLIRSIKGRATGLIADDFMKDASLDSPIDREPSVTDSRFYSALIRDLRDGRNCIISDVIFCDSLFRASIEAALKKDAPSHRIQWEFFENDPRRCEKLARLRKQTSLARELALIRFLSKKYFVPVDAKAHAVWNGASRLTTRRAKARRSG